MWNFLMALFLGSTVGSTRTAQRLVRPLLVLVIIGSVIAGTIYMAIVLRAVSERNRNPHVYRPSAN
jgi:ABC-type Na+ efflux pump permease subunit